jgi:ketosteroid isomerase-like protein
VTEATKQTMATPREVVERLRVAMQTRNNDDFIDQFADDGVYETPFALADAPSRFEGIDEVRRHLGTDSPMAALLEFHEVSVVVHESNDPEIVTAEFTIAGKSVSTGEPFRFPSSIGVIRIREGKIVYYRDHANILRGAQIAGALSQFAASLTGFDSLRMAAVGLRCR